jgi:predicted nucleic acid-binding protein
VAFVAVYDANVLYPGSLRDLLVRLAQTGLFQARWSDQILNEMVDAITRRQPELSDQLARTRELMTNAVPDCLVTGFEPLIDGLTLPDPDDRHVLAAAIRSHAQVIVTMNLRDFPSERLDFYDIEAQTPDEFVLNVIDLAPARVITVLQEQARQLVNPPSTVDDLLGRLRDVGLPRSVAAIRHLL